jgi:cytoskeletal protein CcmA (bactofilin family)
MANPLKILTVLTASQAAKFEQAVEASASLKVSAGNFSVDQGRSDVQDLYATNLSSSGYIKAAGNAQVVGNGQFGGTLTVDGNADFNAQLTASALKIENAADIDGALDVGGAAEFAGAMHVVGNADFDAQVTASMLRVEGAAYLDSTLKVVGNADFDAQLTASALLVENNLKVDGDLTVRDISARSGSFSGDLGAQGALAVGGNAAIVGNISARSGSLSGDLAVAGAAAITGDLSARDITARSGSLTGDFAVAGNAVITKDLSARSGSFSGDVTVAGNLLVQGSTTTIDSTTLTVADKNIEIAKVASPTDTTADGAGITVKGATDKTFNWVDATDAWTSSEHMDLASGKKYMINNAAVVEVAAGEVKVGGAADVRMAQKLAVEGDAALSSSLYISGSAFNNAAAELFRAASGFYDVDDVLHALASSGDSFKTAYNNARFVKTDSLSTGTATIGLVAAGANALAFAAVNKDKIALDITVSTDGGASWTNDLVAVKLEVVGVGLAAALQVTIDAPGLVGQGTPKYRLVAVYEGQIA